MILEKLSKRIAVRIKSVDPDGPGSIEVLEYGIGIKLNLYIGIILTVIFGYIFSSSLSSLLALFSFMVLRKFSGGVHLPITICSFLTGLVASLIPLIVVSESYLYSLGFISFLLMWIYAPNNYEDINTVEFNDSWSKWISMGLVLISLLLSNTIISISFFIQSILILPIYSRKGGV